MMMSLLSILLRAFGQNLVKSYFRVVIYSRSSRKRPPRELEKVLVTGAGRVREWALVSDHALKQ